MKRFLYGFLAVFFLILNTIPYLHIMADDMPTSSQYEMLGAYALSTLITSGEATELDFSDYTENDTSFLIDLGEAIFTGDWSGLAEDGLEWLGDTADSFYDSYKEYISQWKSDHLGLMYSTWFPDEEIFVGPDDSYSLSKPLRQLLTPRNEDDPLDPSLSFIYNINYLYFGNNEFFSVHRFSDVANGNQVSFGYPLSDYSYYISDGMHHYPYTGNGQTVVNGVMPVMDIYINDSNPTNVTCEYSYHYDAYPFGYYFALQTLLQYNPNNYDTYGVLVSGYGWQSPTYLTSFGGISTCFNYLFQHFYHVNIYLNNEQIVFINNVNPSNPVVIPGQLTIWNEQPLEYSFPADTHIDLPDLTNIIRNAINSSGVVMWTDIADTYVDVNGQTAVAVTRIIRNDYDNLYNEQYPYPAMLIGMTDATKFNEHLLDNSHGYLSPMVDVVEDTIGVLPAEIVGVLVIGAILTIFAVIINRLLE